ncbi:MAG: hypothetical protein P4M13_01955 [Alphaproteobacteria bacterium]|nr:hypothetical protein [Alphaproteobacteria bacterium]
MSTDNSRKIGWSRELGAYLRSLRVDVVPGKTEQVIEGQKPQWVVWICDINDRDNAVPLPVTDPFYFDLSCKKIDDAVLDVLLRAQDGIEGSERPMYSGQRPPAAGNVLGGG